MNQQPIILIASIVVMLLLVSECTYLLPLARRVSSPVKQPYTAILTHADIVRRFVPSALLKREDLYPGVLLRLEAREACRGWKLTEVNLGYASNNNHQRVQPLTVPNLLRQVNICSNF